MKRKNIAILVAAALVSAGLGIVLNENVREAKAAPGGSVLYVGGGGPNNYTSIQSAINDAINGDTVYVFNGRYYENIVVTKSINLIGEDRNGTIIDGGGSGDVVKITADGVRIEGFKITGSDWYYAGIKIESDSNIITNNSILDNYNGIFLYNSNNNTITNNNCFSNSWKGIGLGYSTNNTISNNNCSNNYLGIFLGDSNNNTITNNNCFSNSWEGIGLADSNNNKILGNTMFKDGIDISGNQLFHFIHEMENNTVNGKQVYYWKNINGGRIPEGAGQVILINCRNVIVENQELNEGSVGILIAFSSNITLTTNNICKNNKEGIRLYNSNNNTITNNNCFSNSWEGIGLGYSTNNTISNNNCSNNCQGIDLLVSRDNIVSNNNCSNNSIGISVYQNSFNNILTNNICKDNLYYGIQLYYSNNNTITNNSVSSNNDYGIWLSSSSNNTIYNCNISNNNDGIHAYSSSNNTIYNCNIYSNNWYGICLNSSSNNNIITSNYVYNNYYYGIWLFYSSNTEIHYNNIYNNTEYGIYNDNTDPSYRVNATYNWWGDESGPYHPTLNPDGQGDNVSNNVDFDPWLTSPINNPPVANFSYSPLNPTDLDTISFTDLSYDLDGFIVNWTWDFGDGNVSYEQNPTHQYMHEGTYNVSLTVIDNDGAINSTNKAITVNEIEVYGVNIYCNNSEKIIPPNGEVYYTLEVTNTGSESDVINLQVSTSCDTDWYYIISPQSFLITPNSTETVTLTISTTLESPGMQCLFNVTATSSGDPTKSDFCILIVTIGNTSTISFDPSQSMISIDSTGETDIKVNNIPNGLSGYNITISLSNFSVAEIIGIEFPSWATLHDNSSLPADSIWIKAVDLMENVDPGDLNVTLATLSFKGLSEGVSTVEITVSIMDDDNGDPINPLTIIGKIHVISIIPLPCNGCEIPTDINEDGKYEDINGNGWLDFDDVVKFFKYFEWMEENEPANPFDFNDNGLLDFADIVELFKEV